MAWAKIGRTTLQGILAGILVWILSLCLGCETINATTLEENRGAYDDAREFLAVGRTTRKQAEKKFGQPRQVHHVDDGGTYLLYARTETVLINAYSGTPTGTTGAILGDYGGYQSSIDRTTTLELFFNADHILAHYRIRRGVH